jgi:glutamate 5-kinase
VVDAASGKRIGTRFSQGDGRRQAGARKLWLALGGSVRGGVFVDAGAVRALREQGSSLLPVGVRRIEGDFAPGQAVDIRTLDGFLIGRGIANYSSDELRLAAGRKSSDIAKDTFLRHLANTEVIHRDQLVVF